jgi:hypothetical protein
MGEHRLQGTTRRPNPITPTWMRRGVVRRWLYKHAVPNEHGKYDMTDLEHVDNNGQRRPAFRGANVVKREMRQEYGSARQRKRRMKQEARNEHGQHEPA